MHCMHLTMIGIDRLFLAILPNNRLVDGNFILGAKLLALENDTCSTLHSS